MKKVLIVLFCALNLIFNCKINAQYTGNKWVLGDSAGINFMTNPPSPFQTGIETNSGSASICDGFGNLLFYGYAYDDSTVNTGSNNSGILKTRLHQTMQNSTHLFSEWYHVMTIIPKSITDSLFYVFTAGVSHSYGLYFSLVDLKQNNGLGAIIQKNIQLQTFPVFDGLTAVKHGNGKDWWLICQNGSSTNNEFYIYKIDSSGINAVLLNNIGSLHNNGGGDLTFNSEGTKMIYVEWRGMVELYDFDRCTGTISNPILIEAEHPTNPYPVYVSTVFSPNGRFVYINSYNQINNHQDNYLYQYDLSATNIASSRIIIDSFPYKTGLGMMEMGPDKKIYISIFDEQYNYPFADTVHTSITDNLSVINSPDSLGAACDFQPFSFYLGGRRTYYGLPNNPDYTLGPLVGSPCDTITAVHEIKQQPTQNELKVFYHPTWDVAFINADKLHGKKYTLQVYDITGKEIFKEQSNLNSQYFTNDLGMSGFAKGVYIVTLQTEMEVLSKKFVKY